jgi:hypothetical protein
MDFFQPGTRGSLFFMHIPKTAGMSMRLYLSEQYRPDEICKAERWQDFLGHEQDLRSFRLVRGHFRYNLRDLVAEDARMLVVMREPLRRTVSALRHLRRDPNFHQSYAMAKDLTLPDMIRHPEIMSYQRDVQARFLCASRPAAAVSAWLEEQQSRNRDADAGDPEKPPEFQLAADRLETIDFVGLTEDLGALLATMAEQMNYHPPLYFPFINENPARIDPLDGLAEEELQIVREHNKIDLQLYDFAKALIARRSFERSMRHLVTCGVYQVPPDSFEIDISGIMPGSGWYETERNEDLAWRWTGPGRHFTIEVPLRQDASYRFALRFNDVRPAGPEHFAVEINDLPLPFELWPEGRSFNCEMIIPQPILAKSSGFCRIRIDTGDTVQMREQDIRLLGIQVLKIEFMCLEP